MDQCEVALPTPFVDQDNKCFSSDIAYSSYRKEHWGSAFMAPCSIHLICVFQLFNEFFFSILCFFPSADSISARILVLFLPTFLVCAKGVSAVADPFLKIRVTKSCFDLDLADPQALLPQGTWLVLVEGWGGERHLRKARQKFCCHGPVSLQILSMEEL